MGNNAIDNSNLLQMNEGIGTIGFVPVVTYTYDAAAKTVAIHDASTLISGDAMTAIKVRVHDFFGGEVRDVILAASGGRGYTSNPDVVFHSAAGTGAEGHGVLTGDKVTSVVIDTAGTGYVDGEKITFTGGGGMGARGSLLETGGAVDSASISNDNNDLLLYIDTLDTSKQLAISVTYLTDSGVVADGGAYGLMAAGSIGHWDIQKNAQA